MLPTQKEKCSQSSCFALFSVYAEKAADAEDVFVFFQEEKIL